MNNASWHPARPNTNSWSGGIHTACHFKWQVIYLDAIWRCWCSKYIYAMQSLKLKDFLAQSGNPFSENLSFCWNSIKRHAWAPFLDDGMLVQQLENSRNVYVIFQATAIIFMGTSAFISLSVQNLMELQAPISAFDQVCYISFSFLKFLRTW